MALGLASDVLNSGRRPGQNDVLGAQRAPLVKNVEGSDEKDEADGKHQSRCKQIRHVNNLAQHTSSERDGQEHNGGKNPLLQ